MSPLVLLEFLTQSDPAARREIQQVAAAGGLERAAQRSVRILTAISAASKEMAALGFEDVATAFRDAAQTQLLAVLNDTTVHPEAELETHPALPAPTRRSRKTN